MSIFLQIIKKPNNPKNVESNNSIVGEDYLYPSGTIRTVRKLTIWGYRIMEQVCSIETACDFEDCINYNKWKTVRTYTEYEYDYNRFRN